MKYSINGTGFIVAERDIHSLGGFIPKGKIGGKIASEAQLPQDGECWLAGGDISGRPDIVIKDSAYIGTFTPGANPVHTDGIMEFSGNTLIPGNISVRSLVANTKNNFFAKDSFIGISMDVLCGPKSTTTAFPFEQGSYNNNAAKGTLFENMAATSVPVNICRSLADLRLGKDTYLYVPTGYSCRVLWAYYDTSNRLAYSGESIAFTGGLHKLSHPVYKVARMHITKVNGTAMTPTDLLATGAKILGHINSSANIDICPESTSGSYAMIYSSLLLTSDNFGLATKQQRLLAGGMYNTTMYTKTDRSDYKLYGTFRNVERLEYTKYIGDSHRTAATRDTYISAYACPLLRVDDTTYNDALADKGDLVLRRCIVPKASFTHDIVNGNTYEDIDFSYANEFIRIIVSGRNLYSSHREGLYACESKGKLSALISYPGNMDDTAKLYQAEKHIPLDGDLVESGSYSDSPGMSYEDAKTAESNCVRMARPLATFGATFPSMPTGYAVLSIVYLDPSFIITGVEPNPTSINTDDPYFLLVFKKGDGNNPLPVNNFVALNRTLTMADYTKVPEITGSAYVGAGCTVRGDVKLIGDPYVNRLFDVNTWEVGTTSGALAGLDYEASKAPTSAGNRYRFVEAFPVESGGTISCAAGYYMCAYWYGEDGLYLSQSNWGRTFTVSGSQKFVGIVLKKATAASDTGGLIDESDIPLANVKYVRAFKNRRYIVNKLDRTSPEDILLSADYWEQGTTGSGQADAGKTYEELKATSETTIRLKRPINVSPSSSISSASGFSRYIRVLDAVTKFHLDEPLNSAKMALLAAIIQKDPSGAITPSEIPNSRLVLEFVPQPRIIVPYGSATLLISGPKIRMYDNAVLSRNLNQEGGIVLQGDAVMGYDFNSGSCMCSNGHGDAIIKLP